jgi:hypothetical protein
MWLGPRELFLNPVLLTPQWLLASLATRRWPGGSPIYTAIRKPLRITFGFLFLLALLTWLPGVSAHGPNGNFGAMVGFCLITAALRLPCAPNPGR